MAGKPPRTIDDVPAFAKAKAKLDEISGEKKDLLKQIEDLERRAEAARPVALRGELAGSRSNRLAGDLSATELDAEALRELADENGAADAGLLVKLAGELTRARRRLAVLQRAEEIQSERLEHERRTAGRFLQASVFEPELRRAIEDLDAKAAAFASANRRIIELEQECFEATDIQLSHVGIHNIGAASEGFELLDRWRAERRADGMLPKAGS